MRPLFPLLFLAFLSGCATQVKELHELNPTANDFPSALASEYRDYADSEYELGRTSRAAHFADKGLSTLKGEAVEPEAIDSGLSEAQQQSLQDARAQLVKILNNDMKRVAPQKLAHAQLLFDCWQNELLKNINQAKAPCQEEFHSTAAELQEVSDAIVYGKETSRVIVFTPKSTAVDEQGLAVIKEIAQRVAGKPHYRVLLVSYTGRAATQRHLTELRLGNVRHALVKAGVAGKHIKVKKAGGAKAVVLGSDRIAMDTKKITILVKTQAKTQKAGER